MSPGIKGMDAGAEALGLTPDEEALRSSREYALYYYKNRLANPRLPPPLPARNSPWPDGKFSGDVFADLQGKGDHVDATISLLFGQLREGSDPIPIQRNLLGQELGGLSSSLGAMPNGGMSPAQRAPDTLAAAWSNISAGGNRPPGGGGAAAAQPRGPLLGAFGSPKTGPALAPLLTAELKAQASGNSIFSVRSGDEQALTEALLHGANSTPHTPMNGQNPVGNAFFGSFNDSPRPSLDVTGRTLSSNSMGGAAGLGKGDPKLHGAPAGGRLGSVIGDARSYMRTPSKLRIGTTVADPDPQQQLLDSLTSADAASVAAAAAAAAAAVGDADAAAAAAAAAAAQQLASASAMQAAVEALQNLPPAAIAAALGTGDHAAVAPDVLLGAGAAGVNAQQQMQAMYMAAMYPAYYAQQMQQAQQMQSLQAMQAAAMAGFPGGGFQGAFPPGAFPPGVPMGLNSPVPGLQPNPAMFGGAGGPGPGGMLSPDMAMLAAGMRSPTAAQLAGKGFPGAANPADPYAAYYHKMLEAQAALGGALGKDAELLLRAGVPPPPPPPPGQPPPPPPPPKDRRMDGLYGHHHLHHGSDGGMGMGGLSRTNSNGREAVERLNGRGPGPMSGSSSPPGHNSGSFAGAMGGNSRLRATTGPGEFVMGPREGRDARGDAAQRRHSARRDGEGGPGGEHSGGAGSGHGARGPRSSGDTLLDEFKSNKTGKKYELKDILGHVCEFSLDQHGSRFIQQKLEGIAPTDLDAAFSEVLPRILHLMTDVFGNYVVQKFLEHGSLEHRAALAKALRGHVLQLSLQMYGCRVVQKALEVFTEEQQIELIAELDGHIMRCVRDQNGNHVIQKCIECVPTPRITAVLDNFLMCVVPLSTHPFGCRIIQRILEHVRDPRRRAAVMSDILASAVQLTQDQYGNYVIQHVLERGTPEERSSVAHSLAPTVVMLSMHKFASNVIEKCLTYGSTADRNLLVDRMLGAQAALVAAQGEGDAEPEDPVQAMMKDQFGNYVVQKVLEVCTDEQREVMLARVRQQLHALKRFTYGKHIVARVEKLLSAGTRYQTHSKGRLLPDDEALAAAAAAAGRLSNLGLGNEGGGSPAPLSRNGESTGGSSVVAPGSGPVAEDSGGALAAAGHSGGGADGGSGQPSAPVTPPATAAASDGGAGGYGASAVVEEAMAAAAAAAAAAEGREVAGEQLSEGKQGPGGGEEAVGGSNDKQ